MQHYETESGVPTRGITYAKLTDLLREAQDCAIVLAQLYPEGNSRDRLMNAAWMAIAEMLRMMTHKITELAQK